MSAEHREGADVTVAAASVEEHVEHRWVALVRGADRPGTLTALTSVFSTRGVSFESLATGAVDGDAGTIAVTFRASQRRRQVLMRSVERLSAVRAVAVRAADDPSVRAAGVVHMPDGVPLARSGRESVRWSGDAESGHPVLVEGTLAEVLQVLSEARAGGAVMTATVVLGLPDG